MAFELYKMEKDASQRESSQRYQFLSGQSQNQFNFDMAKLQSAYGQKMANIQGRYQVMSSAINAAAQLGTAAMNNYYQLKVAENNFQLQSLQMEGDLFARQADISMKQDELGIKKTQATWASEDRTKSLRNESYNRIAQNDAVSTISKIKATDDPMLQDRYVREFYSRMGELKGGEYADAALTQASFDMIEAVEAQTDHLKIDNMNPSRVTSLLATSTARLSPSGEAILGADGKPTLSLAPITISAETKDLAAIASVASKLRYDTRYSSEMREIGADVYDQVLSLDPATIKSRVTLLGLSNIVADELKTAQPALKPGLALTLQGINEQLVALGSNRGASGGAPGVLPEISALPRLKPGILDVKDMSSQANTPAELVAGILSPGGIVEGARFGSLVYDASKTGAQNIEAILEAGKYKADEGGRFGYLIQGSRDLLITLAKKRRLSADEIDQADKALYLLHGAKEYESTLRASQRGFGGGDPIFKSTKNLYNTLIDEGMITRAYETIQLKDMSTYGLPSGLPSVVDRAKVPPVAPPVAPPLGQTGTTIGGWAQ